MSLYWHVYYLGEGGGLVAAASPPGAERRVRGVRGALAVAPSLRVLPLANTVRLQLVIDEVVLGFALLAAVLTREPLVAVGLRVHIEHMLAQVGC